MAEETEKRNQFAVHCPKLINIFRVAIDLNARRIVAEAAQIGPILIVISFCLVTASKLNRGTRERERRRKRSLAKSTN